MGKEIELKLALPKTAVAALRRHPLLAAAEKCGNARTLVNTYFDTADLKLHARKIALRTRKQGRQMLQTVKCEAGSSGGLSSRPEWEQPFAGRFDFSAIDDADLADRLRALADELVPVFTTRFRRESWRATPAPEVEILLVIDTGTIDAGARAAAICEVELELVRGRPAALIALASQLASDLPLIPADVSKAERGYRLFTDTAEAPVRAGKSPLQAHHSPLEAFRLLAGDCLHQWQTNALTACEQDDPEYIHQMRVALRRLRSLIKLFDPALPNAFVNRWQEILRDTASDTGEARNFDVLVHDVLAPIEPGVLMSPTLLDALRAHAVAQRDTAREHVRARLTQPGVGWRMLEFAADLTALSGDALDTAASLTAFAQLQLDALRKRARKRFNAARQLTPTNLHELRVSLKQLRYAVQFFEPLFDARALKPYGTALSRAQDQLGYVNDLDIAQTQMLDWLDTNPALGNAVHFVLGWHTPQCARVRRRLLLDVEAALWHKAPWKKPRRARKPTKH